MAIDCDRARHKLDHIRRNRRSQSPQDLADTARSVGYTVDKQRGKGSHWYARQGPAAPFAIPTARDPVAVGTTTQILRVLQEAFDDVCT